MHYFLRLMRELHPGDARPAVDIATRWIRQPIEQVTQEVADGWLDTNQPSGTRARPFSSVVIGHETHGPLRSQGHRLLVERLSKVFQKSFKSLRTDLDYLNPGPWFATSLS
jgi:hypothetical protein